MSGNVPPFWSHAAPVQFHVKDHATVATTVKYRSFSDGPSCDCFEESTLYV